MYLEILLEPFNLFVLLLNGFRKGFKLVLDPCVALIPRGKLGASALFRVQLFALLLFEGQSVKGKGK